MELSGDRKIIRISLDISHLFLHIVFKLVQALVITCNGIFQASVVEGDVPLLKPFLDTIHPLHSPDCAPSDFQKWLLDLNSDSVVRWKLLALETFFQFDEHMTVQRGQVGAVWQASWNPEMASGAGCHIPLPGLGKSYHML
jgi:hypothetical protein